MRRPRWLCRLFRHPGATLYLDRYGEAMVTECEGCRTISIQAMTDMDAEDYERVLGEWFDL